MKARGGVVPFFLFAMMGVHYNKVRRNAPPLTPAAGKNKIEMPVEEWSGQASLVLRILLLPYKIQRF